MALAAIYLGSLYTRLDECVTNVARSLGHFDMVSHMDSILLHMFLWECSWSLAVKPVEYSAKMPNGTGVVNPAKSIFNTHELQWVGVNQSSDLSLSTVIDLKGNFNFKPYMHVPIDIHRIQLFEKASFETLLVSQSLTLATA